MPSNYNFWEDPNSPYGRLKGFLANWKPFTAAPGLEAPTADQGLPPLPAMAPATGSASSVASLAPTTPLPNMLDRIATNLHSPVNRGLMHMGLSMMATPPRAEPYSDLEVLGRGGLAGMGAMEEGFKEQSAEDTRKLQVLLAGKKEADTTAYRKSDLSIKQQRVDKMGGGSVGKIAPISPKDYTPESVAKYSQTGNVGDLRPIAKAETESAVQKELEFVHGKDVVANMTLEQKRQAIADLRTEGHPKTMQPYSDPKGNVHLIDPSSPGAQEEINKLKLKPAGITSAEMRAAVFGILPNAQTGAYFKRLPNGEHGWFVQSADPLNPGSLKEIRLSADQMKQLGLETKEQSATERVRTMQQIAPRVLSLAQTVMSDIQTNPNLGPAKGRWRDFWQGKVGTDDPAFSKLRTDIGLLSTLLMNMHVGARGGEQIIERFERMLEEGKQTPQNLEASLNTIIKYAKDTSQSIYKGRGQTGYDPDSISLKLLGIQDQKSNEATHEYIPGKGIVEIR